MQRDLFELLLKDLYEHYNPSKAKDVPMLLDKYKGREMDAVTSIFIMYNSKYNTQNYNPEYGTEQHVRFLINKYSNNERVFSREILKRLEDEKAGRTVQQQREEENKKEENIKQIGSQLKEEIQSAVNKQVEEYFGSKKKEIDTMLNGLFESKSKEIVSFFEEKRIDIQNKVESIPDIVSQILEQKKHPEEQKEIREEDNIEVKINFLNFEGKDLILPSKEYMKNVSIGERLVVYDSDKKICGLEVKDITCDAISFDDGDTKRYIKDITLEKLN